MDNIAVRLATFDDAPSIADFHVKVWRHTYGDLAPPDVHAALDETRRRRTWGEKLSSTNPDEIVLVAETQGRTVAIGAAGPPSAPLFGGRGEIKYLYVDPDMKRRGLGRRLLSRLAAHLRERGFRGAGVGVVHGNEPAIAFYSALDGERIGEYTDPGPIWRSRNIVFVWDDSSVL